MITDPKPELDLSVSRRFGTLADDTRVQRATAALEGHGFTVLRAADGAEARRLVLSLIPEGAQVHHGASQTLEETGITEAIEHSGRYDPVRPRIWSMDRTTQEDARAQAAYGIHSGVNKVLIINREIAPGRITVVLVDEVLGF